MPDPIPSLHRVLARRRMVRAFTPAPVDPTLVTDVLERARRAPSAGHTQAVEFLVLTSPQARAQYWDTTLAEPVRTRFRWSDLLLAPVLIIVLTRPDAYVARYAEPDKARPGLGEDSAAWPVPYWWVDAGAVIQNLLLLATAADLGACLFGLFAHEEAVLRRFAVPDGYRAVATVALGHPAPDTPGRSATRARPSLDTIVHLNGWGSPPSPPSAPEDPDQTRTTPP